jgi:hypothetical protein
VEMSAVEMDSPTVGILMSGMVGSWAGRAGRAGSSHGHIQATNGAVSSCEAKQLDWGGAAKSGCSSPGMMSPGDL